jgi:hypothetical protein
LNLRGWKKHKNEIFFLFSLNLTFPRKNIFHLEFIEEFFLIFTSTPAHFFMCICLEVFSQCLCVMSVLSVWVSEWVSGGKESCVNE